jgi:hypothetical protein
MHPFLQAQLAVLHQEDLRREAAAAGFRSHHASGASDSSRRVEEGVVIRRATPADGQSLAALAALDGAEPPLGEALIAEVGGSPRAVLPMNGERPFGDPFRRTRELVALLELRAAQLRGDQPEPPRRRGRLAWMAPTALRRAH